jgi:hypothetical protein
MPLTVLVRTSPYVLAAACYKTSVALSHINIRNNLKTCAILVNLLNYMGKEDFHEGA